MDTVLTLHIDRNIAENAEMYAKKTCKSVSQLVEEYLTSISSKNEEFYSVQRGNSKKRQLGSLEGKMSVTFEADFSMTDEELLNS